MLAQRISPTIPVTVTAGILLGAAIGVVGTRALLLIAGAPVLMLLLWQPKWSFWLLVATIPVTIDFGGGLTVTRIIIPLVGLCILSNALLRRCPWPNPVGSSAARIGTLFFLSVLLALTVAWLNQTVPLDTVGLNTELAGYATRLALFFVTLSFVQRPRDVRQVLIVLVVSGVLESLIVVAQMHFRLVLPGDWRFSAWANVASTGGTFRAEGTTPHPVFLAGFLQMVLPFAVLFLLRARRIILKLALAVAVVLILYAWYAAYSRSSLVAIVLMVAVAVFLFSGWGRALVITGGLAFLVLLAAHGWSLPDLAQTFEDIRNFGAAVRRGQLTSGAGSLQFRLESSAGGWNLFMANPLFGVGLAQAIHQYLPYLPHWAVTPFHPVAIHNAFLEVAAESGIMALLFFSSLWLLAFRGVLSAWNDRRLAPYARALFIALVGQFMFVIMTPMVRDVWFTLPLAAACGQIMAARARDRQPSPLPAAPDATLSPA